MKTIKFEGGEITVKKYQKIYRISIQIKEVITVHTVKTKSSKDEIVDHTIRQYSTKAPLRRGRDAQKSSKMPRSKGHVEYPHCK